MRIAVSGATGFIGRHVVAELLGRGAQVVALCRKVPTEHPLPLEVAIVSCDLASVGDGVFEQLGRPDALIHLAWDGLPNYKSLHHFDQELPVQYRFLSRLVKEGLSTLVVTGTCFEYGMQSGALSEQALAQPTNPYGFAKNALRRQLEFLRDTQTFAMSWARLFYMHGSGQAANSLLPQLHCAVERGDASFNMSGGEQLRDYLPVTEIARVLVTMAAQRMDAGVVNLCSGAPVSVRRFVESELVARAWNIRLNLGFYPYPDYEPFAFWGNRARLDTLMSEAAP